MNKRTIWEDRMYLVKTAPETRKHRPLRHVGDLERHVRTQRERERRAEINKLLSQSQHSH
jgi:hypothetical protein